MFIKREFHQQINDLSVSYKRDTKETYLSLKMVFNFALSEYCDATYPQAWKFCRQQHCIFGKLPSQDEPAKGSLSRSASRYGFTRVSKQNEGMRISFDVESMKFVISANCQRLSAEMKS